MTNVIPRAIADVELQVASAISPGTTSFTLNSTNDDDGNALPAGLYCFTLDSGTSNKEYLIGQLNGVNITSVKSVSRQGVETTGAARPHRIGAPCIVTNFATLQRVADILRGALDLDGSSPVSYDAEPTLSDRSQLATVGYVLDTVTGGTVSFDRQTVAGTGGATIAAGNLIYFDEADQEWKLCDADTAATVEGVMRGLALGAGSDGVAITGGVLLGGVYTTTGLTAGAIYYASNTAGALATSAGTTKHIVGVALSTTRLWVIPQHRETIPTRTKDALAGGGDFGTPSTSNKFLTQQSASSSSVISAPVIRVYTSTSSPHTWTKPANLKYIRVRIVGAGGDGATDGAGGGGGGYAEKIIAAASLGATETITLGAGGVGTGNSTFGSILTVGNGSDASGTSGGAGGSATGGDVNIVGQSGGDGNGGKGGDSFLGQGGMQRYNTSGTTASNGMAGFGYGAGGSGGQPASDGTPSGGTGGLGSTAACIVEEHFI